MFSALFWKHVRQAKRLVWYGLFSGVVLPPLWIAMLGHDDLVDGLDMALVPMINGLIAISILTGDAFEKSEPFLRERPISPVVVWLSRLAAAASVTVAVNLLAFASYVVSLRVTGVAVTAEDLGRAAMLCAIGVPFSLISPLFVSGLGLTGGSAAITSILGLGAMLFAGGRLVMSFMGVMTWAASFLVVSLFLVGAALSLSAAAFGEPNGRGRRLRTAILAVLGVLLFTPAFLAGTTWVAQRAPFAKGERVTQVLPGPAGRSALTCVGLEGKDLTRCWLLSAGATPRPFFGAHVRGAAWSPTGDRLAVASSGGRFGSTELFGTTIHVLDVAGHESPNPEWFGTGDGYPQEVIWAGDRLLFRLETFDVDARFLFRNGHRAAQPAFEIPKASCARLLGSTSDGAAYVAVFSGKFSRSQEPVSAGPVANGEPVSIRVVRFAPGAERPEEKPVLERAALTGLIDRTFLSRSGHLLFVPLAAGAEVDDLLTGASVPFGLGPGATKAVWLEGDRLAWIDGERLLVGRAGETPREVRSGLAHAQIEAAPNGRALLLTEHQADAADSIVRRVALCDVDAGRCAYLAAVADAGSVTRIAWIADDTLLRVRDRVIELVPLARPDAARPAWD